MNIMRQSACLVVNPITVYSYGFFFNLHDGGSGLILNDGPDGKLFSVGWCLMLNLRFSLAPSAFFCVSS